MALKRNTLTECVAEFHQTLSLVNFTASSNDAASRRDIARAQQLLNGGNARSLMTGAAVVGCDVYEPDPTKTTAVHYGGKLIKGTDTLLLLEESNSQNQSNAMVDAHEAMETFVKCITATFLYAKRGQIPINQKDRRAVASRYGKKAAKENTLPYCRQLTNVLASRNCSPLFTLLFKYTSNLQARVARGHFGDHYEIHLAVEFIRHSKTHANGRINLESLAGLPKRTQAIIRSCVKKSIVHGDGRILPTSKAIKDLISREAEFAQILYDELTQELNMQLDYKPS